jgi:hypothetical protein
MMNLRFHVFPGKEHLKRMILNRFEALPGLGLSGKGESLERGLGRGELGEGA